MYISVCIYIYIYTHNHIIVYSPLISSNNRMGCRPHRPARARARARPPHFKLICLYLISLT